MMKQLATLITFLISLTFFSGCGGGAEQKVEEKPSTSFVSRNACNDLGIKVFGGEFCSYERSPVVAVIPVGILNGQFAPFGICTGTMVTVNDVLTAAHCVTVPGAIGYVVIANNEFLEITGGLINPLYDGSTGSPFDIAMLTLAKVLDIPPVPIHVSDWIEVGERISVYGYGLNETGFTALEMGLEALKGADMTIAAIVSGLFAAAFDVAGTSICQGDSGGPAIQVIDGISGIVGVTSFTYQGCQTGSVSGFVDMQINGNVDFVLSYAADVTLL